MADDKPKAVRGRGGKFLKVNMQAIGTEGPPMPDGGAAAISAEPQGDQVESNFIWAARQIVNGRTVRRASWLGAKTICALHPSRNILENEDFLADDWVLL